MSAGGEPADDPGVLFADSPGTLLPTGGREYGHKGDNVRRRQPFHATDRPHRGGLPQQSAASTPCVCVASRVSQAGAKPAAAIRLYPGIMEAPAPWAERFDVALPAPAYYGRVPASHARNT
ncbi:MAG TPA: hypothetical protein VFZ10_00870 [Geminicoccaceae bacterium]